MMPTEVVFHRDFQRKRRALWVCVAFVGAGFITAIAISGLHLNTWLTVPLDAVLICGVVFFGGLAVASLSAAANVAECLAVGSDSVRCSLPGSVPKIQRQDVRSIRLRESMGYKSVGFDIRDPLDTALSGVPFLKRLGVRYSVWRGYGAISVSDLQITESLADVQAALAELWPEVQQLTGLRSKHRPDGDAI